MPDAAACRTRPMSSPVSTTARSARHRWMCSRRSRCRRRDAKALFELLYKGCRIQKAKPNDLIFQLLYIRHDFLQPETKFLCCLRIAPLLRLPPSALKFPMCPDWHPSGRSARRILFRGLSPSGFACAPPFTPTERDRGPRRARFSRVGVVNSLLPQTSSVRPPG